jgi:putative transposase
VNREFSAAAPGEKMVSDITYIPTWEGWLYLAKVIDCATRKVAGWAMDDNYRTPLITSAIQMAARNLDLPEGAVFHSDGGSNYTSAEFAAVLERARYPPVRRSHRDLPLDRAGRIVQCRGQGRAGSPHSLP